jgi:hypothetical protein
MPRGPNSKEGGWHSAMYSAGASRIRSTVGNLVATIVKLIIAAQCNR